MPVPPTQPFGAPPEGISDAAWSGLAKRLRCNETLRTGFECMDLDRIVCRGSGRQYRVEDGAVDMIGGDPAAGGPAQRLMETTFYSSGYETLFRPALTRLVTAQGLEQSMSVSLAMLEAGADDWVLDVGSGTGNFSRAICASMPAGEGHVVAVDLSRPMLRQGSRMAGVARESRLVFVRANALLLPFTDASFDAVHSSAAIQLFDRPQLAVNEMARVCRPGGALVLATFVRSSSWGSRQLQKWVGQGIGFSWFTPDALHAMLQTAGFEVREEVIEGAAITLKGIRRAEGRPAV